MILHVIKSNIYSGAENVVCQIIHGLEGDRECIYMAPHGPIEDKLKELGLYQYYYGIDSLSVQSIKRAVNELKPSIVHAHDFTASVLCALALKDSVPIISHLHNNPPWIQQLNTKTLTYLKASKYFKHLLVVSDAVKNEYRYTSSLSCPITVVGNPFSVNGVCQRASQAPKSDLLFVGRITEQKDPMLILKIAKQLHEDKEFLAANSGFTLRMVGQGDMFASCQDYVHTHNMSDYVILEGFKENSYSYMANTTALIMPSKWEGFGLVALEAMALGVPVVSSGNGGLKNIVDSSCGYVCKSMDDYVTAIKELLLCPEVRKEKSCGAVKRATEYDSINSYIRGLKLVYANATNSSEKSILHVFKSNIYSGAENVACQIITGLNHKERFLYLAPHGPIENKLSSLSINYCFRGLKKLNIIAIRRLIKNENVKIIHAHDFTASIVCALASKGRIPVVSHLHQNPPWLKSVNIKTLAFLFASRWISNILVVSNAICEDFIFSEKLKAPTSEIGNPFSIAAIADLAQFEQAPASDMLFVGRLVEPKNPMEVLQIAKLYKEKYGCFTLRLIGDGELSMTCQNFIRENSLSDSIFLEGFKDNPYTYMSKTKVLLMPSKWEGFGLVALEAMALGIPVLCSGAGGLSSIIDDTCGYICHSDDDYVDKLHHLLTDSEDYEDKRKGAVVRAQDFDNISDYLDKVEKLYSNLSD